MNRSANLHFTKIYDHFSGDVYADRVESKGTLNQANKPLLVHFTNRSGSNYFCDLLCKASGRTSLYESLNWDTVVNHSNRLSIKSFSDYFSTYICGEPSILKANTDQLYMLIKWGYLKPYSHQTDSDKPCIISVQRSDVISQAVSFAIAMQTGKYASFQELSQPSEITFDPDLITRLIAGFGRDYQDFLVLSSALDYNAYKVYYEELVAEPKRIVADACSRTGVPCALEAVKSKFEKQANEVNQLQKQKYIEMLNLF